MIFRFNAGLQFWPGDGNFSLDMYFGVGLGTYNIRGNYLNWVDNNGNAQLGWTSYSDSGIRFNAATGIKFGFGMDEKLDLRIKINGGLFEFGKLEHPTVNSFFLTILFITNLNRVPDWTGMIKLGNISVALLQTAP